MLTISRDELGIDADMHHQVHKGVRFTGVAREVDAEGQLISEAQFVDGIEHGISREWFKGAGLKSEAEMWNFVIHGEAREWHENGNVKAWRRAECGYVLEKKEWDESGNLVNHYQLPEDHVYRDMLLSFRKNFPPVPTPMGEWNSGTAPT